MATIKLTDLANNTFEIPKQPVSTLGRSPNADVTLDEKGVSAFHCTIHQKKGETPYIRDSSSKNGTYVDNGHGIGQEIYGDGCAYLSNETKITLGDYKLNVRIEE